MRSFGAVVRAAERDARRRQREIEKRALQQATFDAHYRAALAVEAYDNYIERLQSVHKECSARLDWTRQAGMPRPHGPVRRTAKEDAARRAVDAYEPNWWDRLFRLVEKKRTQLDEAVAAARAEEQREYEHNIRAWETAVREWESDASFARRVLAGEDAAYIEVIREVNPFSELSDLGTRVSFETVSPRVITAEISVHGADVIPREIKTLLRSGKVSSKAMPIGRSNELQQDYVCSSVLRVANELFAILPVSMAIVTATDRLLNTQTGHLEDLPVLSAAIPRATLNGMNLDLIDPSDAMRQFLHRMDFKKTRGFAPVDRIAPSALTV